jgi:hypothetical protein
MFTARRYIVELGAAFALYAVLLVGANLLEHAWEPTGGARIALSLVPMVGALAAAWAIMRGLWRMDELQRRIQLDAIAMAFMATALVTFGWGFVENDGVPHLRAFMVWPIMAVFWSLGIAISTWRYR